MTHHPRLLIRALITAIGLLAMTAPLAVAQETPNPPKVRAVLFFSPTCGHCEYVIREVLPAVFSENGGEPSEVLFDESSEVTPYYLISNGIFEVLLVDVTIPSGFELFATATESFVIGNEAVPRLIIGTEVLIGSEAIPERLPAIVEEGLFDAGIDWPELAGLEAALESIPQAEPDEIKPEDLVEATTSTLAPIAEAPAPTVPVIAFANDDSSVSDRFGRDVAGNTAAVVVLLAMLSAMMWVGCAARRMASEWRRPGRAIAVLAALGMGVAAYLGWVEISSAEAVCGPIGDCNTVQQSAYAAPLGVPIGVLGVIGYAVMLGAWLASARGDESRAISASAVLFGVSTVGVLFSIYLTFLEPFVIGASCIWCLSSAVIVTLIMLLAANPGFSAWERLRPASQPSPSE